MLFTTTIGRLLQESAQSVGGTASDEIAGDGTPGAATVTASVTLSDGTEISGSITVQTSSDSPNIQLLAADGSLAAAVELRAAETEQITAEVLDWDGTAISGVGVAFESTALSIDTTSGVTDSNGRVTVTLSGTETQEDGTLTAAATFSSFDLSAEIVARSLGVNTESNRITLDAIDLGTDGVLDGNEKVQIVANVLEDGLVKDGISVVFTAGTLTLTPTSATSAGGGIATVQLTGDGMAGTAEVTVSATLSNGISVTDSQTIQTTEVTPSIDLVIRDQSGVSITTYGANQEMTLEVTILDHDGSALDTDDAGVSVTFDVGNLGTVTNTESVTEFEVCPTNLIPELTDCAFVGFTSNSTAVVGEITVTATINGIVITGSINPNGTTAVTGVGTVFELELVAGDRLKVRNEVRTITGIAGNTSLTVDTAFSDGDNDVSPKRVAAPGYLGGMGQPLVPWAVLPSILMIRARPVVVYIQVLLPLARIPVALHQWS